VLATVTTTAHRHDDDVRVNVATGDETTAVGTTIACMTTGATAYFVRPEEYTADEEPVGVGVAEVERLPTYPIGGPSEEQVAVLGYLRENRSVARSASTSRRPARTSSTASGTYWRSETSGRTLTDRLGTRGQSRTLGLSPSCGVSRSLTRAA